jgi:hypothetical protein
MPSTSFSFTLFLYPLLKNIISIKSLQVLLVRQFKLLLLKEYYIKVLVVILVALTLFLL